MKKKKETLSKKESVDLKSQLARALADYDNLRKRIEKEREGFVKLASFGIVEKFLPILDMFEEAQEHLKDSGLAIAIQEFVGMLDEEGIEKIKVDVGGKFDEQVHEAVEVVEPKEKKLGVIVEEVLPGWKYKEGLVIRPAKVKATKKK